MSKVYCFTVSHGLRGCYMPDSSYVIGCTTRRQLKEAIAWEANSYRDAGFMGASKRAIATMAAECWTRRDDKRWTLDLVLPLSRGKDSGYAFGVFVSRSTLADWQEQEASAS